MVIDCIHFNKPTKDEKLGAEPQGERAHSNGCTSHREGSEPTQRRPYETTTANRLRLRAGHASEGSEPAQAAILPGPGNPIQAPRPTALATSRCRRRTGSRYKDPPPAPRVRSRELGYRPNAAASGMGLEAARALQRTHCPKLAVLTRVVAGRGGRAVASPGLSRPTQRRGATGSAPGHRLPSHGVGLPRAAVERRLASPPSCTATA